MSTFNGRLRLTPGDYVLLQARIKPAYRRMIADAAAASGVSTSLYVGLLLEQIAEANDGHLPTIAAAQPQLPIDSEGDAVTPAA